MNLNRATRRALRRALEDQRCGACGGAVDERAHQASLLGPDGQEYGHLICVSCFAEACSGPEGQRAVAARARLTLAPVEGRA